MERRLVLKKRHNSTCNWWLVGEVIDHHPNLTLRAPAALSKARAQASDTTVIDRYIDLLEKCWLRMILLTTHSKF